MDSLAKLRWVRLLLLAGLCALCGCQSAVDSADEGLPDDLLSFADQLPENEGLDRGPLPDTSPATVRVGEQITLVKRIAQEVVQTSSMGLTRTTQLLELGYRAEITALASDHADLRLSVMHCRLEQDLGGEQTMFDSRDPSQRNSGMHGHAPLQSAMVGDGFSIHARTDGQVISLPDFADFMSRCADRAPPALRAALVQSLQELGQADCVVALFDDTLCSCAPPGNSSAATLAPSIGESWTRKRQISIPVPMTLQQSFTVSDVTSDARQIDVLGTIWSGGGRNEVRQVAGSVDVQIRGGNFSGTCDVQSGTGLPLAAKIDHFVEMGISAEGTETFPQRKKMTVTIERTDRPSGRPTHAVSDHLIIQ